MPDKPKYTVSAADAQDSSATPMIHRAVVDLQVARRNVLIYPASHDQVKRGLSKFFKSITVLLAREPSITLAVLKDGLTVNEVLLHSNSPVFGELAAVLKEYQIAALTFAKGLEPGELVRFMRIITADHKKIAAAGGIAAIAESRQLVHIKIQVVDYSKLQLTRESEIQRSSRRTDDKSIWQTFVSHLLAGDGQHQPGGANSGGINLDPDELADMLNQRILSPAQAIASYEQAVTGAGAADGEAASEGFLLFQKMIRELNPELQNQFLATTFDRCDQVDDYAGTARLIEGLGAGLIIRMLRQAGSSGKQISPSLLAFISKIGHLETSAASLPTGNDSLPGAAQGLSTQNIESLLNREEYDTYVDNAYGKLLKSLSRRQSAASVGSLPEPLENMGTDDLSEAGINTHVGRAMTRLMITSAETADYRDWARQLAYLLEDLLDTRAFEFLTELLAFARTEQAVDDEERSEIAGLLLGRFSEPQFVARTIDTVQAPEGDVSPEALGFLMELGEPVVMEIFDDLDPSQTLREDGVLTRILRNLSSLAIQEALERIKDPRPEYVCRMLRIIQKMGDGDSAQQVRLLLDHDQPRVRLEALATLLKFNISWGVIRLRELLARPLDPDFMPAMELAGKFRVRAVVPQLTSLLEQNIDFYQREASLRTLGRIGDTRAVPALTRLAGRRWTFSQKQTGHLKRVLFETLKGYPPGEVKHLLHLGLKQRDHAVQAVCREMLREATRAGGGDPL